VQTSTNYLGARLAAIAASIFLGCSVFAPSALGAPNDRGDADGDGMSNYAEFNFGTNPDDPDTDHDSLIDPDEVHKYNTNPNKPDTDDDGLSDRFEIDTGSDPLVNENVPDQGTDQDGPGQQQRPDRDGDGMFDDDEINGHNICGCVTDPDKSDTDGDDVNDGAEDDNGTNPLDPNDQ
jgi:Bacterial TSP3 repeat